jgi:predicted peptidase
MLDRFTKFPTALKNNTRWMRLGAHDIPAMLVHPDWAFGHHAPIMLWMHGRTANKELDPGRYLRWMRAGIGTCAIDLPGYGERIDEALQHPRHTFDIIRQMHDEIDSIVQAVGEMGVFDMRRLGIGGMSAGGMATLARLCTEHPFICAAVEGTSGSWMHQAHREMFKGRDDAAIATLNPMDRLGTWREIPIQAIHAQYDEWVTIDGQRAFINALRTRYQHPELVQFVTYGRTGAPYEHAGFGKMSSDAKDRQRNFLKEWMFASRASAASPAQL